MNFVTFDGRMTTIKNVPTFATMKDIRKIMAEQMGHQVRDEVAYRIIWKGKQLEDSM